MGYFFKFATLLFTVYGQLLLKWRLNTLHFKLRTDQSSKLL